MGREASKKKTYPDVRGGKPNLLPLSRCGNILVPAYIKLKEWYISVRPRLLPFIQNPKPRLISAEATRPWLSSFCFVFHRAEQGVN